MKKYCFYLEGTSRLEDMKVRFSESFHSNRRCDYDDCQENGILMIPWGFNGFPGILYTCPKHACAMTNPFIGWAFNKFLKESQHVKS